MHGQRLVERIEATIGIATVDEGIRIALVDDASSLGKILAQHTRIQQPHCAIPTPRRDLGHDLVERVAVDAPQTRAGVVHEARAVRGGPRFTGDDSQIVRLAVPLRIGGPRPRHSWRTCDGRH